MIAGKELIIFDLGTGVRNLGATLKAPTRANIFVTHYHYDHIQGLPFFGPVFDPQNEITIHGPTRDGRNVKNVILDQMQQPFFPITADMAFRAQIEYRAFKAGDRFESNGVCVTAIETKHPGGCLAYRLDYQNRSIVYATDTEQGETDKHLIAFARGADLLICDAMYTEDEYLGRTGSSKIGWGHSTWESAVQIGAAADVKTLVLFHHDPSRSDAAIDRLLRLHKKIRKNIVAAREGLVFHFKTTRASAPANRSPRERSSMSVSKMRPK